MTPSVQAAGQWRPNHSILVHQADNKARLLVGGRKGVLNDWSALQQTSYITDVDCSGCGALLIDTISDGSEASNHESDLPE